MSENLPSSMTGMLESTYPTPPVHFIPGACLEGFDSRLIVGLEEEYIKTN